MKNIFKSKLTKFVLIIIGVLFFIVIFGGIPIKMVRAINKVASIIWEKKGLSAGINGYVLEATGRNLVAFDIRNKSSHIIRYLPEKSFSNGWRIEGVTGPSRDGKVVYLVTNWTNEQTEVCELRMCNLQGSDDILLSDKFRTANFTQQNIAISPDGKWLAALFIRPENYDWLKGGYPRDALEIYRLPSMEKVKQISPVINTGISWFPDSSSFVYCAPENNQVFIRKLDIQSWEITDIVEGLCPYVAPDGATLVYLDFYENKGIRDLKVMNLGNKENIIYSLGRRKNEIIGVIGVADPNRILYVGVTTGMHPSKIQKGSVSLKVAELNKETFETLSILADEDCGAFTYMLGEAVSYGVTNQ